jgi:16S rRNA (cytidine1402-2'-O)-methyltransferase
MWKQSSFQSIDEYGKLYIVPTPIGNLEDMTFRAIKQLKEVDYIAAEDTRQTKKLCNYFEITTPLTSYHEHNKKESGRKIITDLKQGKSVAVTSDAGMPCISDPGFELVKECVDLQIPVIPLPGANAALTSLVASGLPTNHFYYYGFLGRGKKEKKVELESLKKLRDTIIFYESPHRLKETVKLMNDIFGDRNIVLSRELTKKFEEFIRGSLHDIVKYLEEEGVPRGEFCLVVEGSHEKEEEDTTEKWWQHFTVEQHVHYYIEEKNFTSKEAIKQVAVDREVPKRDIYQEYHT